MIRPLTRREAGWLLFDAPLPDPTPRLHDDEDLAATLLGLNATLPAGCKYALAGASDLRVRAEQPEPAEPDVVARMAEVEEGFVAAADQLGVAETAKHSGAKASSDAPAPELASLCREAGWLFKERSDGALLVDLGVSGSYVTALVEARVSGIAIETIVVTEHPDAAACRAALAALLLRANGAFRMARAVFHSADGDCQALFEAPLPAAASAVEFGMALGAVAVAAQHCAVAAQMLAADERLARAYLERCRTEDRSGRVPEIESSAQVWA